MPHEDVYKPRYEKSWALIIGINGYQKVSPLRFARGDAEGVSQILQKRFKFEPARITLLLDCDATRQGILQSFFSLRKEAGPDDRVLVFFAGHGHTESGRRGEVGFLVPVEGDANDLSTLIRWDELTRNGDLIDAKHVFYIMDACYGGLAVTRRLSAGSMRFLKDMLRRYSRQVLAAGKGDEVVSDGGGPKPGHSIFTGHLLAALEGDVAYSGGVLSANGLMAYVYGQVSSDLQSQQSPHYGFIDGDGDFIFDTSALEGLESDPSKDDDVLVTIPPTLQADVSSNHDTEVLKEFIADSKFRIKLDDLMNKKARTFLAETSSKEFQGQNLSVTAEEFATRLKRFERAVEDLRDAMILLSRWTDSPDHRRILAATITKLTEVPDSGGGFTVWLAIRYYPALIMMYVSGIAALVSRDYETLACVFNAAFYGKGEPEDGGRAILGMTAKILDFERTDIFKHIPGYEKYYTARSEYLFKSLQPVFDDLLFLGRGYEALFDRFEVFWALTYADARYKGTDSEVWGPVGRFGWKESGLYGSGPLRELVSEAAASGDQWAPLKAGFFQGSEKRFLEIASAYAKLISGLGWH